MVLKVKMRLASTIEPTDIPISIQTCMPLNGGGGYVVSIAVGVGHVPMMQVCCVWVLSSGSLEGGLLVGHLKSWVS